MIHKIADEIRQKINAGHVTTYRELHDTVEGICQDLKLGQLEGNLIWTLVVDASSSKLKVQEFFSTFQLMPPLDFQRAVRHLLNELERVRDLNIENADTADHVAGDTLGVRGKITRRLVNQLRGHLHMPVLE